MTIKETTILVVSLLIGAFIYNVPSTEDGWVLWSFLLVMALIFGGGAFNMEVYPRLKKELEKNSKT